MAPRQVLDIDNSTVFDAWLNQHEEAVFCGLRYTDPWDRRAAIRDRILPRLKVKAPPGQFSRLCNALLARFEAQQSPSLSLSPSPMERKWWPSRRWELEVKAILRDGWAGALALMLVEDDWCRIKVLASNRHYVVFHREGHPARPPLVFRLNENDEATRVRIPAHDYSPAFTMSSLVVALDALFAPDHDSAAVPPNAVKEPFFNSSTASPACSMQQAFGC
jgi:hypothetical protein